MTGSSPDTFESRSGLPTGSRRCDRMWSSGWFIAAMVVAFMVFWPLGLAMLVWAFWHREIRQSPLWRKLRGTRVPMPRSDFASFVSRKPDNAALAEYLGREQDRLREEQRKLDDLVKAFEAFKDAERQASDRRDFENFLKQREQRDSNSDGNSDRDRAGN